MTITWYLGGPVVELSVRLSTPSSTGLTTCAVPEAVAPEFAAGGEL